MEAPSRIYSRPTPNRFPEEECEVAGNGEEVAREVEELLAEAGVVEVEAGVEVEVEAEAEAEERGIGSNER
jgi:hypothetical protein